MSEQVKKWVDRLTAEPEVALQDCIKKVEKLSEDATTRQLAGIVSHDPLYCAGLFRQFNVGDQTHISSVNQLMTRIGSGRSRDHVLQSKTVEGRLGGRELAAYKSTLQRAYHCASLAWKLAELHGYSRPREFFYAGLMYRIGEIGIRLAEPALAIRIDRDTLKGKPWGGKEEVTLGFSGQTLSLALAKAWYLPELLQQALEDAAEVHKKTILIRYSDRIITAAAADPSGDSLNRVIENLAEKWECREQRIRREIFVSCMETTREKLEWFAQEEGFISWFPHIYKWPAPTREKTRPRAEKPAAAATQHKATAHDYIQAALNKLHEEVGLSRVVFALSCANRKYLQGRYFSGVDNSSNLRSFKLRSDDHSLFSRLMKKPQMAWVNDDNRADMSRFYNPDIRRLVGNEDYFAGSIFLHSKPVGLLYADAVSGNKALDEQAYSQFKKVCSALIQRLEQVAA